MRKRDIALQAVTIVLAFGVGILLGRSACAPGAKTEPDDVEPEVVEKVIEKEKIVYECPPESDAGTPAPREAQAQAPTVEPIEVDNKKSLPEAEKPPSPLERQRLLAWVRDQSVDLEGCRRAGKEVYRLAVTLQLGEDGNVRRVNVNAPPEEVPRGVLACLRKRMADWQPPAELVKNRNSLVFGLTI